MTDRAQLLALAERLERNAGDCENMERWATPELAPLLREAALALCSTPAPAADAVRAQTIEEKRLKRVLSLIEENAKLATPGPWSLDHGQVIKHDYERKADGTVKDKSFDVACQPWERRMAVRGLNPTPRGGFPDMRHIATCDPRTMLQLVEDVRAVLARSLSPATGETSGDHPAGSATGAVR